MKQTPDVFFDWSPYLQNKEKLAMCFCEAVDKISQCLRAVAVWGQAIAGHAAIASDYRAGGPCFDTGCSQILNQRWCSPRT